MNDDSRQGEAASADPTARYLASMLQLNPLAASDEIIARRSKALRLTPKSTPAAGTAAVADRRAAARQELQQIRQACWAKNHEELIARLDRLAVDDFPELQAASERLRTLLKHRPELARLAMRRQFDGDFFGYLKPVLAASPRETGVLREQAVAAFRSGTMRKRGRRMIKLLRREAPGLYILEADWFESLLREGRGVFTAGRPPTTAAPRESSSNHARMPGWAWWLVGVFVIRIISILTR